MKISMLTLLLATSVSFVACSQTKKSINVPSEVKAAFESRFKGAKNAEWEMESKEAYEVSFKMKGDEYSANFSLKGDWLETETEIKEKDLPQAVLASIQSNFSGFEIEDDEAEKVESPNQATLYEVILEKDEEAWEVQFSADGKVVKKTKEEEDEDDEQ